MAHSPRAWRLGAAALSGVLLVLAACSPSSTMPAPTPTTLPTAAPVTCGAHYGSAYQATLPDASFQQTTVYAQVPLPPQTRAYDDDAAGLRVRLFCSAGTTANVSAFMVAHLTAQGWQPTTSLTTCGRADIPNYGQPRCWQQGNYNLFMGINSNTDWLLAFVDPAFLQ